ncbi:L-ribulose-5-phosphate 4-epimerase AraD [Thorsellia anophelis]|uniref:L-ribulose-5-phosphate 4-epimerase n=1 Tax=Thorsellia anophelis DSM 18579 TaxID=1123402 RepID=A0A1I0B8L4_9GAMM|nr:L-ribulose-5-phosphate 4-epimerase AraD [Thorsellia anophelis]SET03126.1 L-ribulose 5-phosphate 4-epimerase [Thorsellia anophelis DSM 18579]
MDPVNHLDVLKEKVLNANLALPKLGLVKLTWGNVSLCDRENNRVIIKPSGVDYAVMTAQDMVVVDLSTGEVLEGVKKPSSDLQTHLHLYRTFSKINSVIHTHSKFATIWAQSEKDLPALGTTHADYFLGNIPCTRRMTEIEVKTDYELNTGKVISEMLIEKNIDPIEMQAVLVAAHGPFVWGESCEKAVENALVLEEIAEMAIYSKMLTPTLGGMDEYLLHKHYFRKHGQFSYYGQN